MYIADGSNNRIIEWVPGAANGTVVAGGNGGSGSDELDFAAAVYLDNSGNIFIADYYNNRIQKWAQGAKSGTTVAGQ